MKVIELHISNWKSFPYNDNPKPIIFNKKINIFIGPNSSGKTNLANALRLACGYRPHSVRDPKQDENEKNRIPKGYFKNSNKPIEISIKESENNSLHTILIQPSQIGTKLSYQNILKESFFPIGATKALYGLTTVKSYTDIFHNIWNKLRDEAVKYFGIDDLPEEVPSSDHLFSDLLDKNGQVLYNAGSGIASVLYYMIELKIHVELGVTCFLFEEPELHMHSSLLRQWIKYLMDQSKKLQFFITTHSSLLIDETLRSGGYIFQIVKDHGFTKVSNITEDNAKLRDVVYKQLGNIPNDLLLANAIIWVEGPSDIIYLRHWLKVKAPELIEYKDYSFMFYGGSLVHHISFENIDIEKLIELCIINTNSIIIIDSDRSDEEEELGTNKRRVEENFEGRGKFTWITGGREIENYIHPDILKEAVKKVHPKTTFEFGSKQFDRMVEPVKKLDKVRTAEEVIKIYESKAKKFDYNLWGLDSKLEKLKKEIKEAGNK